MATPKDPIWEQEPHTQAKHRLLKRYLDAWFPIFLSRFQKEGVTYVDAFAGPGSYTNDEDGSPLIALRCGRRPEPHLQAVERRYLLVEQDKKRHELLLQRTASSGLASPPAVVRPVAADCREVLESSLSELQAWGAPIFVNLDSWGVVTPHSLVRRLREERYSEILITFQHQFFQRFAGVES